MKKKVSVAFLIIAFICSFAPIDLVSAVIFDVTVTIEAASGVTITADKRDGITEDILVPDVAALNFDPMTLNGQTGVFESGHFFTIDAKSSGDGAGDPQVIVTYAEGNNPNGGQSDGLGFKSTAAFTKVTFPNDIETITDLNAHGKKLLKDINGELVTAVELEGAFLRMYVGVFLGDDQDILDDGGLPFTAADEPGAYTGTLTVTGVII